MNVAYDVTVDSDLLRRCMGLRRARRRCAAWAGGARSGRGQFGKILGDFPEPRRAEALDPGRAGAIDHRTALPPRFSRTNTF